MRFGQFCMKPLLGLYKLGMSACKLSLQLLHEGLFRGKLLAQGGQLSSRLG